MTTRASAPLPTDMGDDDTWGPMVIAAFTELQGVVNGFPPVADGISDSGSVHSGSFTATAGRINRCDTSGGALTVTLPTAPTNGTLTVVKALVASAANPLTIACGGSDVFNKTGGSTSVQLVTNNASVLLQYASTGGIWMILATDPGAGVLYTGTRLDQLSAPTADVAMGTHKFTGLANGTGAQDGAAFGQIAAAIAALLGGPSPAWPASTAGVPAYTLYQLPTGGLGYLTATRTTNATFDATERAAWICIPGRHYEKVTSGTTWTGPTGITRARFRLRGGGGGGGGGGSAATGIAQVGGGGGGAGAGLDVDAAITATTVYTLAIGAAGTGGTAGAAGGNAGGNGTNGGDTTITIGATTYTARGGGRGLASGAGATTAVSGGHYGNPGGGSTVAAVPGQGGASGAVAIGMDNVSGGSGGGVCTTTLGGSAGNARTAPGGAVAAPAGNSGTSSGVAGTSATEIGCGGGGGGGGTNNTGAGAVGGAGVAGQIEVWF